MLYKVIDVWRRTDAGAIRYRCFELIPSGHFCVQSADFYRDALSASKAEFLDCQFVELFLEQPPDDRSVTFATLEEAIARHDLEFGN
jgi:hypothetical protein